MTCNVRKLPDHMECPLDNIVYKAIDKLSELSYYLNMTPNIITTISFMFGLLSIYYLHKNNFKSYSVCFFIYYVLDLLDGYHARKYNQCTKFGDYYDHARDFIIFLSIIVLIYIRSFSNKKWIIAVLFIFLYLFFLHMSCQELHTKDNTDTSHECHSHSLSSLSSCKSKNWIVFTRHFGMGTFSFIIVILSYLSMNNKK